MTATPDPDRGQVEAVDPTTGRIAPAVLDALGDQLDRRRAERQAEAEHRKATLEGPCSRCGCPESWLKPGRGGWHRDARGPICQPCNLAMRAFGLPNGVVMSDSEFRAKVILDLLGPEQRRWQYEPLLVAKAADIFAWFCEVPGAEPGRGPQRFGYVDVAALLAHPLLHAPPPPPPVLVKGPRCPRCRRRDAWAVTERPVSGQAYLTGDGVTPGYIEVRRVCHGDGGRCRYEPEPERRY
jgi:hypothetical protein